MQQSTDWVHKIQVNARISPKEKKILIVLNSLFRHRNATISEIARTSGFTVATIAKTIGLLEAKSIIRRNGAESVVGSGRKPAIYELDPSTFLTLGVDAGITKMNLVVCDLFGQVVRRESHPSTILENHDHYVELLLQKIKDFFGTLPEPIVSRIAGIGISLPGLVDQEKGISLLDQGAISLSPTKDIPIASLLTDRYHLPVFANNNARTMALAEARFGTGLGFQDICCINVGFGIGLGLVLQGELITSETFPTSGLGHLTILPQGPKCHCGNFGCVEAFAGGYALIYSAITSLHLPEAGALRRLNEHNALTAATIASAAIKGDRLSSNIIDEAGRHLGIGISNLISLICPQIVIIGGRVAHDLNLRFIEAIKKSIQKYATSCFCKVPIIELSKLGFDSSAAGACAYAFEGLLNHENLGFLHMEEHHDH